MRIFKEKKELNEGQKYVSANYYADMNELESVS